MQVRFLLVPQIVGKLKCLEQGENILPIKDCRITQFTGFIHQKTKKEIFEGDIFRSERETDFGDERVYLAVTWIKQRGAFYLIPIDVLHVLEYNDCENEDAFDWLFTEANLYDFSIDIGLDLVGNIYENKELFTR